jgi:carbonic anhydrase/acetyltransferase-like protein (isoleucine patch superfamily)
MGSRTNADSVERVAAPPDNLLELERGLAELRRRHPGAVLERYLGFLPELAADVYLAPTAVVVGRVRLAEQVSIWPACVLRGDVNRIEVGPRSNLQDGTVVHVGDADAAVVGADVVVGHRAVIHGCRIEDAVLVGIQATVLDGAVVGEGSVIGAGAVVTAGTLVPPRSLVLGVPGRVVKTLDAAEEEFHRRLAGKYTRLAHNYRFG